MNIVRNVNFILLIILILLEITSVILFINIMILSLTKQENESKRDEKYEDIIFLELLNCFLSLFQVGIINLKYLGNYFNSNYYCIWFTCTVF